MQDQIDWAKNFIVDFYRDKDHQSKKEIDFEIKAITNLNSGLGDTLSTMCVSKLCLEQGKDIKIYSNSHHFPVLARLNPWLSLPTERERFIRVELLQTEYKCGGGHLFQKIQRVCGLSPDKIPKADIIRLLPQRRKYVALCFSVGAHAAKQRHIHPRARELYPEVRQEIQNFINDNKNKYHFYEIGTQFTGFDNVENKCGLQLRDSIIELCKAEYFFGMHSGVMHLAAALDIKSIILINFPSAKELVLPLLKDIDIVDGDWLEPQFSYLHLDEDGPLVKQFNRKTLEMAFDGQIYPYFKPEEFCDLI